MTLHQWIWRLSSRAPLPVWGLALLLPIVYGGWTLQSASGVDPETLQRRIAMVTDSLVSLQAQLQTLDGGQEVANSPIAVSEDFLDLLLRHRCGMQQGFEISRQDGQSKLLLRGDSLEAMCALRVVRQLPGVVRQLRRNEKGQVNFIWEEIAQ
ncbi:MAG: hypothetical protein F4Y00_07920 [Bacteroidetes bacterium SB0662_bin_6]|nr:hypothetical protein [Bacteroidetes bacterium SB0662_bin_6]